MSANQAIFSVRAMCRVLEVSASGYCAWRRRTMSVRAKEDQQLQQRIRTIHLLSRHTYGTPRIQAELREEGMPRRPEESRSADESRATAGREPSTLDSDDTS